ncbi:hypothetical protein [Hymenobacter sediminis]|nr:hypothetical protein [Hymenobacter sediminis]
MSTTSKPLYTPESVDEALLVLEDALVSSRAGVLPMMIWKPW